MESPRKNANEIISEIVPLISSIERRLKPAKISTDEPRHLTNEEIVDIVSSIPHINSSNKFISKFARNELIKVEKSKLRQIKLGARAIPEFKKVYISKFELSKIEPGSGVGITAAEATSAPASQQTFNSFHSAGSSKNMISGIDGFMETLEVRNRKRPLMAVFFNDHPTVDDILITKNKNIRNITVADCVFDQRVEAEEVFFPNKVKDDWYDLFRLIMGPLPQSAWFLRLYLDLDILFKNRIRPQKVSEVLSAEGVVKCVYSPIVKYEDRQVIIMDVYIHNKSAIIQDTEFKKSNISERDAEFFYFNNILLKTLDVLKIQGLNRIRNTDPIIVPVGLSLYAEFPISQYQKYQGYSLIQLNWTYMNSNLIKLEDVIRLLNTAGVTDIQLIEDSPLKADFDDLDLLVKIPPEPSLYPKKGTDAYRTYGPYSVITLVKFYIEEDKKEIREYRRAQKKLKQEEMGKSNKGSPEVRRKTILEVNKIPIYRNPSPIYRASNMIYMETSGSDFSNLFKMSDVDHTRSYTNNMYELLKYFGIEVVRNYFVRELLLLVKNSDSYIDPRHATVIADWVTAFGFITPLTSNGMAKHKMGSLANAAFRGPMEAVKNESLFNKIDTLENVSSSIALGKKITLGTGLPEIKIDQKKIDQILARRPKEEKKKFSSSATTKLIEMLEMGDTSKTIRSGNMIGLENDPVDIQSKFEPVNIPIVEDISDVIESNQLFPDIITPQRLLPIVSKELKRAIRDTSICETPQLPTFSTLQSVKIESSTEPLPLAPIIIPENMKMFQAIEKPPEVTALFQVSSLDDLF